MVLRLEQFLSRLASYPFWQVVVEVGVIWIVVFAVIRFVQGTRAAGALKGTLLLIVAATLLIRILGREGALPRLRYLYENLLALLAVTLVVVFQPELRRGLIRLGETPLFRRTSQGIPSLVEEIVTACEYLSKARFGALIVLQREVGLAGLTEGGTEIGARVSARLLQTLFFPGSALHDLAVIIRDGQVHAAGVQLPLAEPEAMPDPTLGSRHRAAVGLSRECDAIVVVVSEETGAISIAERGRLDRGLTSEQLTMELVSRLSRGSELTEERNESQEAPGTDEAGGAS